MNTDRPVSLDLGVASDAGFQANPDNPMGAMPGEEHRRQPGSGQEQQLEDAAALLSELLKAGEAAPPLEPPPATDTMKADTQAMGTQAAATQPAYSPATYTQPTYTQAVDTQPADTPVADGHAAADKQAADGHAAADTHAAKSRVANFHASDSRAKEDPHVADPNVGVLRPFDLFSKTAPIAAPAPPTPAHTPAMAALESNLVHMSRSLLAGEGVHGATVRLELGPETFPGVVMEVFKDQGAIVAQFVCTNEFSRTRLASAVPWLSNSLSRGIGKDTLVRVTTDDPEDPYPVETRTQAVSG